MGRSAQRRSGRLWGRPSGKRSPGRVKEAHIALTPGRDFGEATADTHVRLSYAASREALREGLNRLGDFVAKVRG